jgi:hypothetical protein
VDAGGEGGPYAALRARLAGAPVDSKALRKRWDRLQAHDGAIGQAAAPAAAAAN